LLPADVADADALEAAAEQVEIKLGAIDVWINNAMTGVFSPIKEMTAAEFKRVTEVTYLGFVNGTLNTPQFDWVKSRLPKRAQPVPPIYQPEVAAEAVVYASLHNRREISVGTPTLKAILGNKFFPGLLDHYLARTGYESQQTNELEDPRRPHNLYSPVAKDHGVHGRFDDRARSFSPQLWADLHRNGLGTLALLGLAALSAAWLAVRNVQSF
jgi:short chain dehydrogenase